MSKAPAFKTPEPVLDPPRSSWSPRRLTAGQVEPAARPEIGNVLYRGLRHLVSGEPDTLKGWLLLVLALLELRAGDHVAWVDFEQGPAMTLARLRDLGASDDEIDRFLYIEPREPLADDMVRAALVQLLTEKRPTLAVFDAYAGLLGLDDGDPNSERDIERVNRRYLDPFRLIGATTVTIDHPVKNTGERGRYSSGNGRKLAEVDVHLRLDRGQPFGRGRTGTAHLRVLKDRAGGLPHPTIGTLALTSDQATGEVTWEIRPAETTTDGAGARSFRPTGYMERVSVYLEGRGQPVSRHDIETNVLGKTPVIRAAINALVSDDYADEKPGPRGARLVVSIRPYRETTDLAPPRPHLAPTSPGGEDDDFAPRPPCRTRGEDEVGAADELERLLTDHADIAQNGDVATESGVDPDPSLAKSSEPAL